uniref:Kinesin motor domain-containing protein n=1 Tax=Heterorhabditis bacteriophora TaxID=37862 RepID=A0A1I7XK77_HETBA
MPMPHFDEVPFCDTEIDPDSGHPTPRDEFPVTDGNSSPPPSVPLTSTPLREGGRSTRSFENYIEAADRHMTSRVKREDKRVLEVLKYVITVGQENKKLSRKYEKILNHSQQCIMELEQDNRELNARLARPPIEVFTETKVELVNDYKDASTQDDEVHPYVLEKESLLKERSLLRLEIESLKKTLDCVQQKNTILETEVKNAKIAEERLLEVLNTNNIEVADIQHRNMCLEEDIKLVLDREIQLKEELTELWKKYTLHEKEMVKLRNEAMIIPSLESEISKLQTENLEQNKMLEVEKAKFSEIKVQYDHLKEESSVLRTDAENAIMLAKNLEEQNLDIAEREGLYATESIKLRNMEENLRAKDILVKDLQCISTYNMFFVMKVQISQLKASFETSTTEVMKLKAKIQELESMNDNLAESSVRDNCMIVELKKRQMEFEIELAKARENLRNEHAAREDAEGIAKHIPSKDQEISEQNQRILDLTAANEKMSFEIDFMRKVLLDAMTKERDNLLAKEMESHKKLTKMDSMQNDLLIRDQQIEELRKNIDTHKQETAYIFFGFVNTSLDVLIIHFILKVENFFKHFRDIDKNLISSYENNITEIRRKLNEAVEKHREEIRTKQHSLVDSENKAESLGNSLEKAMVRIKDLQSNLDTLSKDFVKASRDCDGYATAAIAWKKFAEELEDALREANDEAENLNVRLVEAQAVTESEKRRRIALKEELDKIEILLEKEADQRKNMATQSS